MSKRVKLNEFKLKTGFKKIFEMTPYGMLFVHRMNYGKYLLEKSEYNIKEIAAIVGGIPMPGTLPQLSLDTLALVLHH
ncbi:MAG: AraC family transcriptional regulator [Epsilonproteobacteria bacterium]|nr:AraC family transcriptional regulator [Campylobacterota bacterium]